MSLEQLRPTTKPRLIDLVAQAGIDVTPWASTAAEDPVAEPATNPAYCYEWCFSNERLILLSLWHDHMILEDGRVLQRRNMRDLRRRIEQATHLVAGTRKTNVRRAMAVDSAVQRAFRDKLPVRVIVVDGEKRDLADVESRDPSRVERRLLDPSPWRIASYEYSGIAAAGNVVIARDMPLE